MKYKNIQRISASIDDLGAEKGLMQVVEEELADANMDDWEVISIETVRHGQGISERHFFTIWLGKI